MFKKIFRNCVLIVVVFFQITGYSLMSQVSLKSDLERARIAFEELGIALKSDKGELWNYSLRGPVMLVDGKTRTIIANEDDPLDQLSKRGDFFIGRLADSINIGNTAVDWNGKRWTMVIYPLPKSKEQRLNLLIHESFHRIQPYIDFDSIPELQNVHLDTKEGRIYLKLELEALKKALASNNSSSHIKNALQFRLYRYQLFPKAKQAENSLEINEGLAEYTGSILSQRGDSALKQHYIMQIAKLYDYPTFVRSFAYVTIPIYGFFMQKIDENWNLQITQNTNLTDFITQFYNMDDSNINHEELLEIGVDYAIDSIISFEDLREIKRQEQIEEYEQTFLGDSVVSIDLLNMQISFNPSNIMPLDNFGTVYPSVRLTDDWGILEVDSGGALISPNWSNVRISYPLMISDTMISGKGWKLKLNDSWKLQKGNIGYAVIKK